MGKSGQFIKRWKSLSYDGKVIFLKSAVCLLLIKTGLTLLPFLQFRRLFHRITETSTVKEVSPQQIELTVWAVDTAANLLPFELLCLPRALAAKYLLRKVPSLTLEIGIEVNPAKHFEAHAWVENNGTVIMGKWPESVSYHRLWAWK
ncbi:lasso peptide biosynthesis B2 protein [Dyadobacter sediminis]|uniref:Lasso peptide biosynthesis B2 protein n=1 Tax=Dyadobacter sediminis TaxID=1493691 RepID=A0A5R9KAI7_9BACT|nr:lasso peptide biosynthesis B2 protein [Dyadobacter sediminis]TLU91841.1 lasso peptide biosynthesis B2 protein [Dyadobacter sediminis]GGB99819.1 hypothetical protein GCM10011325_28810 [Dyadobacter sediminis]